MASIATSIFCPCLARSPRRGSIMRQLPELNAGAWKGSVVLMDLEATRDFTASSLEYPKEKLRHAVIALHGKFKNKVGEKYYLMPMVPLVSVTDS